MTLPVTRQTYEARVEAETDRLLTVKRDWRTVVTAAKHLHDQQRITSDTYQDLLAMVERVMQPVNRRLSQLADMAAATKVGRRQPDFARHDEPDALLFDSYGRRNYGGLVELPVDRERFD